MTILEVFLYDVVYPHSARANVHVSDKRTILPVLSFTPLLIKLIDLKASVLPQE